MILMPIPNNDFDPTETSVPWKVLHDNNIDITFATPSGQPGKADPRMLTGKDLGIWKKVLMANADALNCYSLLIKDKKFNRPIKWDEINSQDFAGIILPGGHAPGMRTYLESKKL